MKKLCPNLDAVRISNIYIRYVENVKKSRKYAFGKAVVEEVENDLLTEVILNNPNLSLA